MLVHAAVINLFVKPDDQSDYRARTIALSDAFVNIVTTGFVESARAINDMHVHILMDMQGHTRGVCARACLTLALTVCELFCETTERCMQAPARRSPLSAPPRSRLYALSGFRLRLSY